MNPAARVKYEGLVVRVLHEDIELPNGVATTLEIVAHPGGAAAIAVDERGRVCLLRQYRHVAGGWIWELPAGKIDDDEPPVATARRELADEAGISASAWIGLGAVLSSPGVFAETVHLYLARGLSAVAAAPDGDEVLEVHWVDFGVALRQAERGEIADAKTIAGLMRTRPLLR